MKGRPSEEMQSAQIWAADNAVTDMFTSIANSIEDKGTGQAAFKKSIEIELHKFRTEIVKMLEKVEEPETMVPVLERRLRECIFENNELALEIFTEETLDKTKRGKEFVDAKNNFNKAVSQAYKIKEKAISEAKEHPEDKKPLERPVTSKQSKVPEEKFKQEATAAVANTMENLEKLVETLPNKNALLQALNFLKDNGLVNAICSNTAFNKSLLLRSNGSELSELTVVLRNVIENKIPPRYSSSQQDYLVDSIRGLDVAIAKEFIMRINVAKLDANVGSSVGIQPKPTTVIPPSSEPAPKTPVKQSAKSSTQQFSVGSDSKKTGVSAVKADDVDRAVNAAIATLRSMYNHKTFQNAIVNLRPFLIDALKENKDTHGLVDSNGDELVLLISAVIDNDENKLGIQDLNEEAEKIFLNEVKKFKLEQKKPTSTMPSSSTIPSSSLPKINQGEAPSFMPPPARHSVTPPSTARHSVTPPSTTNATTTVDAAIKKLTEEYKHSGRDVTRALASLRTPLINALQNNLFNSSLITPDGNLLASCLKMAIEQNVDLLYAGIAGINYSEENLFKNLLSPAVVPVTATTRTSSPVVTPSGGAASPPPEKLLDIKDIRELGKLLQQDSITKAEFKIVADKLIANLDENHVLYKTIQRFISNNASKTTYYPNDFEELKFIFDDLMERSENIKTSSALENHFEVARRLRAEALMHTGSTGEQHRKGEILTERSCQRMLDELALQEAELREWKKDLTEKTNGSKGEIYTYRGKDYRLSREDYLKRADQNLLLIHNCKEQLKAGLEVISDEVSTRTHLGRERVNCFSNHEVKDFAATDQASIIAHIETFLGRGVTPTASISSARGEIQRSDIPDNNVRVNSNMVTVVDEAKKTTTVIKVASVQGIQNEQYKLKLYFGFDTNQISALPLSALLKIAVAEVENYYAGIPSRDRIYPMKLEGIPPKMAKVILVYCQLQGFPRPEMDIPFPKESTGFLESQKTAEKNYKKEVEKVLKQEAEYIYGPTAVAPLAKSHKEVSAMKEAAHVTEKEVNQSFRPK